MTKTANLKGTNFTLSVLHLPNGDVSQAMTMLKKKIAQAPSFFASAPIVINVEGIKNIDMTTLKSGIEKLGMHPVGITGCQDKKMQAQATAAGLAIMASFSPKEMTQTTTIQPTKVIKTPIRSGQQVYAKNADLVILNNVSTGAEVIADGSIHIRGTLRGRAIAGAAGQTGAKIFCNNLQAELISIAGNYWLTDQIDEKYWHQNVMITMNDNHIKIDKL